MLKITVIANNPMGALIAYDDKSCGVITDLPKKLQKRVAEAVVALSENEVSSLEYDKRHFVFSRNNQNHSGDSQANVVRENFLKPFIETIKLLYWHLGPHMYTRDPDLLGSALICCECGLTQRRGSVHHGYCDFVSCPSHAKWAEVIEGYEPPKHLSDEALVKVMQPLQATDPNKNNLEPSTIILDANKWIQQG